MILTKEPGDEFAAYAFVMPNSIHPLRGEVADYAQTIDDVEEMSGLNFFSALGDTLEDDLESSVAEWPF